MARKKRQTQYDGAAVQEQVRPEDTGPVKVRALREGLYGILRATYEVFTIQNMQAFSTRWMELVEDGEPVTRTELDEHGMLLHKPTAKRPVPNIKNVRMDGHGKPNVQVQRDAERAHAGIDPVSRGVSEMEREATADAAEADVPRAGIDDAEHAEQAPQRRQRKPAGAVEPRVHD